MSVVSCNDRAIHPARQWVERERFKQAERVKVETEYRTAAQLAAGIWMKASPAPDMHPYLVQKGIPSYGLRRYRGRLVIGGMACDGALLLPAHNANGVLTTLQLIDASGTQRFLSGGQKADSFYLIGHPARVLCLAEGYATAASIRQATGCSVAVVFDAGNLSAVARMLQTKFPDTQFIICTDEDCDTPDHPDLSKHFFLSRR